jgi:hypothetical protein
VGAAIAIALLGLLPQLHFRINRGGNWQGANAIMHPDEVAYSDYVASLIRGRPRRNDPTTGRIDEPGTPLPESLFSIQLVPAYAVALPARWLGLSAAIVFITFPAVFGFLSALSIFWFVASLTRDKVLAAAMVWIVLGMGTLGAGQGMLRHFVNLPYLIPLWFSNLFQPTSLYHLPFLRFYQPAVAFPLFFLFCTFVFHALASENQRRASLLAVAAGLIFATLIFSYFFLWTAAAAWLVVVSIIWLLKRGERGLSLIVLGIIAACAGAALIPYFLMLSHRATTVDSVQALVLSHRPDLLRVPELIGLITMGALLLAVRRGRISDRDPVFLFAFSLGALPVVVFNQQILTGRSLQPVHYEWFIANYVALTGLVLTTAIWWRGTESKQFLTNQRLAVLACFALLFGAGEVWLTASQYLAHNTKIDEARPAMKRLAALAAESGNRGTTVISDLVLADRLPTEAPQSVLWAPRMLVFPAVTPKENRERFFQQLYYTGFDQARFQAEVGRGDWNFFAGLFDYERLSPAVSGNTNSITNAEIASLMQDYLAYARAFSHEQAIKPTLSYLVAPISSDFDYRNVDRWYERDTGEPVGDFLVYRLKLKS